jgi:hypothetical protein
MMAFPHDLLTLLDDLLLPLALRERMCVLCVRANNNSHASSDLSFFLAVFVCIR